MAGPGPDGARARLLFCENETNTARLFGARAGTPYPKDGINDHVMQRRGHRQPGARRAPSAPSGTRLTVPPGATVELRLRLRPAGGGRRPRAALGAEFDQVDRRSGGPRPTSSTPS